MKVCSRARMCYVCAACVAGWVDSPTCIPLYPILSMPLPTAPFFNRCVYQRTLAESNAGGTGPDTDRPPRTEECGLVSYAYSCRCVITLFVSVKKSCGFYILLIFCCTPHHPHGSWNRCGRLWNSQAAACEHIQDHVDMNKKPSKCRYVRQTLSLNCSAVIRTHRFPLSYSHALSPSLYPSVPAPPRPAAVFPFGSLSPPAA